MESSNDWTAALAAAEAPGPLAGLLIRSLSERCAADGASVYWREGEVLRRLAGAGMGGELDMASRALTPRDAEGALALSEGGRVAFEVATTPLEGLGRIALDAGHKFVLALPMGKDAAQGLAFVSWSAAPSAADQRRARELVGVAALAASRLAVEARARRAETLLGVVLDSVDQGVIVATPDGRYPIYSGALEQLSGWSREDLEREGWPNLVYPDPAYRAHVMATIRTLPSRDRYETGWVITRKDGGTVPVRVASRAVTVEGQAEPLLVGVFKDDGPGVAERQRQEREERLVALGRQAGRVAHDLNNALALMTAHAELILGRQGLPDEVRDRARLLAESARRAGGITERLQALAQTDEVRPVAVDLPQAIESVFALVGPRRPSGVTLRLSIAPGLPPVDADPTALHRALLNMVLNALEAVGEVGEVRVEAREAPLPDDVTWRAPDLTDARSLLAVAVHDDGPGFPPELVGRPPAPGLIERADGRGMGLEVVQGVARAHGGAFDLRNEHGAVVTLFLHRSARALVAGGASRGLRLKGEETLWVVDDEPALLEFMRLTLESRGYVVRAFGAPDELLAAAREEGPDLLLLNVVMPGWRGRELLDELRRRGLRAPVLWCSGFGAEIGREPGEGLLAKPCTGVELALKVREVLDRRL